MKVLLINPNYLNVYKYISKDSTMILPPLSLAYIAAVLREKDIEVEILDLAALDYSDEQTQTYLENKNFDIIGITAATNTVEEAYKIAKFAKKQANPFIKYQEFIIEKIIKYSKMKKDL